MRPDRRIPARHAAGALAALVALLLAAIPTSATPDPSSALALQGVVLRSQGVSFAVIVDGSTPKPRFYRVGAPVGSGRLIRILTDRVLLDFGSGDVRQLRLPTGAVLGGSAVGNAGQAREGASSGTGVTHRGASPEAAQAPGSTTTAGARFSAGHQSASESLDGVASGGGDADSGSTTAGTSGPAAGQLRFVGVGHDASLVESGLFSAQALRDLLIQVDYANLSGAGKQRLEIYTPEGSLYRQVTRDFTPSGPTYLVETKVPVGGTWITQHSLFGTWSVKVYLDSSASPLATANFVLNQ